MKAIRFQPTTTRPLGLVCLSLLTGSLASCANLSQDGVKDPFLTAPLMTAAEESQAETLGETSPSGSASTIEGIPLPINADEGPVVANHLKVRQVQHSVPPANPDPAGPCPTMEGSILPSAELPGEWCPPCFPPQGFNAYPLIVPAWFGGAAIAPIPRHYPDEYLCDGGDRGYPVRYDSTMRLGLDTEDTVAEYTDHTGKPHVKPSNRVCVYAPRFGAVRSISSPVLGTSVDQHASADKFLREAGMRNRDATGIHKQHTALGNYRTRERASDIDVDARLSAMDHTQFIASHTKLVNTFQDLQFVATGQLIQTDEVRLAKGVQAATLWTRAQFPVIAAQTEQAQEVSGEFRAQELVAKEDRRGPGVLRIVKLADKEVAHPGDVITFTIRYDNLGERELSQIRIIDNLTPRLQYLEDSETSDRAGELFLQDNEEGSVILEFHLDAPLPAGQGGVVTFQTKVR